MVSNSANVFQLTCHFNFKFSMFLFKCLTFERIFTFFFGFCISLFPTAIFHLLCNCEQGNETPPFLRNIYYLHAFSNFQQSQFLLEWIRWFPFVMYRLACISHLLDTIFWLYEKLLLMTHFYLSCWDLRLYLVIFLESFCSPSPIVPAERKWVSQTWTVRP